MFSTCPRNMVKFGPIAAELLSTASASWQRYCKACSSGRQLNFAALNRGRHLCSAGRPSRWALTHISSYEFRPTLVSVAVKVCFKSVNFSWSYCVCYSWLIATKWPIIDGADSRSLGHGSVPMTHWPTTHKPMIKSIKFHFSIFLVLHLSNRLLFSERERTLYAIARPSVVCLSVCRL